MFARLQSITTRLRCLLHQRSRWRSKVKVKHLGQRLRSKVNVQVKCLPGNSQLSQKPSADFSGTEREREKEKEWSCCLLHQKWRWRSMVKVKYWGQRSRSKVEVKGQYPGQMVAKYWNIRTPGCSTLHVALFQGACGLLTRKKCQHIKLHHCSYISLLNLQHILFSEFNSQSPFRIGRSVEEWG